MINIVIFMLCLAIMDNIASYDTFGKYFKSKGYSNLAYWFRNDAWENKYQLKEWLMKLGITEYIASVIARDILVIITDAWHFFKAVGIIAILQPYVGTFAEWVRYYGINYYFTYIITFALSGALFNFLFYSFSKLTKK